MESPKSMIESTIPAKRDRLSAFFEAFDLSATVVPAEARSPAANLVVAGANGRAERIVFCSRHAALPSLPDEILAAAAIDFGGTANPLVNAMPERFVVALDQAPTLQAITAAFVAEASDSRCGRQVALDRLCEVIVLLMLRRAIDVGSTAPGLLAGLSHPAIQRAIVAMHDQPSRAWRTADLAEIGGMSRSRFMTLFPQVVGTTPSAYLHSWRLVLAQRGLLRGERVKSVAQRVGFGSAAAFSRAYSDAEPLRSVEPHPTKATAA